MSLFEAQAEGIGRVASYWLDRFKDKKGGNILLLNKLRSVFGFLNQAEAGKLVSDAYRARNAGRYQNTLSPGGKLTLAHIPISHGIFGNDPQGRRYQYSVNISLQDTASGRRYDRTVYVASGRLLTNQEIHEVAYNEAAKTQTYDARRGGLLFDLPLRVTGVEISAVYRRY